MKLIYKDNIYPLIWKTQMVKDHWYNMEPAKLKTTMPFSVYESIRLEKNLFEKTNREDYEPFLLTVDIYKKMDEVVEWDLSPLDYHGLWTIEIIIYSMSISSKFRDGSCTAIFEIGLYKHDEKDKSEIISKLRDIKLSELV